jgi:hypothetical protein
MVNSGHKNIGLVYEDTPYGYGLGFSLIAAFTSRESWCFGTQNSS